MPLDRAAPDVPASTAGRREVRGACPHDCPDTCAMVVTVENGRAIAIRGAADHPPTAGTLCTKVARYLDRTYSTERVLHPMKRVGAKGSGAFERIGWDEALATIAERFRTIAALRRRAASDRPLQLLRHDGTPAVELDGPAVLPPARRIAARPHDLRDGGQGRLGVGHRRGDGDRHRGIRRQPADHHLGQQSDRVQPAFLDARAGGETARCDASSRSTPTAARPPRNATNTSR